ncbi:MAG TPA: LCP family protein [Anaerolineaceae bacterium]|nr:LCP family protein [Anaerolineaceae bacterium]
MNDLPTSPTPSGAQPPEPPYDPLGAVQPVPVERGAGQPPAPGSADRPTVPPPGHPPAPSHPAVPPPGQQPAPSKRWPDPIAESMPPAYQAPQPGRRRGPGCGCLALLLPLVLVLAYFFAPIRTNILVLGIDRTPEGTYAGRSDTNILVTVNPLRPTVAMLSIPRDLWVTLPRVGEQRINTAHFFAELEQPGSGPRAAAEAVEEVFGVPVHYYARISFDSLVGIADAMGGVVVNLPEPMAGWPAGEHRLNGEQALAFARDRSGTDDFFRMAHGQFLIRSMLTQMLQPSSWGQLPEVIPAVLDAVDTNVPVWLWPRLGLAVLRAGPDGIDSRTLDRSMVTPWLTPGGAQVLLPNWDQINPLLEEMFGR